MSEENTIVEGDGAAYQVLARKYRPQNFDDLIGHGPMVKTLRNAFSSGRIAHAYVLTGVRGVGKTTTARILARALNYVGPDGVDNGPQIDMAAEGLHCRAIAESRHPDVLEMDAASRTGVNDIRELIEGVRYAPVEARYKVYIIDEVHMLSTQAFNALLKTLEEPPPHVKFIFATTEIRKLPVTVLSRCQRFDLRRIEPETLVAHLKTIAEKEGASIDDEGLSMIARAAEGSVRDALSILDQALVQYTNEKGVANADEIRTMLGLADRGQVWDLLHAVMSGDLKAAIAAFRTQYDAGAEPAVIIRDMLEIVHLLTRVKAAGPAAAEHGAAGAADATRAREMADALPMNALTRAWSLLMKGLSETQIAPDPAAAGEMALIRLGYAADLPTPDEALRALKDAPASSAGAGAAASAPTGGGAKLEASGGGLVAAQAEPLERPSPEAAPSTAPRAILATFQDVARLAAAKKDEKLRIELESYVHLVAFEQGRIEMRLDDRAPSDLPGRLTRALKDWTGEQWIVTVNANREGAATLRDARSAEVMAHPLVKKTLDLFPEAQVKAIRDAALTDFTAPTGDETDDTENEG
ncbi:MAG: DNA polymerase III subunit gamma/tau [Pseudomonadota bacterium]